MKKSISGIILLLGLWLSVAVGAQAQATSGNYPTTIPITVQEADGSPKVVMPSKIIFPNGSLSITGRIVTVTFSGSGGTTINSTNGQLPYRVNSTTFGDSAFASNALNSTYLQATSGASGAGLTLAVAGGGTNEPLILTGKGTGPVRVPSNLSNAPGLVFSGSTNTGFAEGINITGRIDILSAGAYALNIANDRTAISINSSYTLGWSSGNAAGALDTGLVRLGAAQIRCTNAATGACQFLIGQSSDTVSAQLDVRSQSTTRPAAWFQAASSASATQINIGNRDGSGNLTGGFYVSGVVLTGVFTVATLPSAATCGAGSRAFVTDANTTLILGIGTTVVGGGANGVPVYSDGTNWLIG